MAIKFQPINYFATIITTFVVAQAAVWLLSIYTEFEFIKMGWILLLFAGIAGIVSIFTVGLKLGNLRREDYVFIGIQFLAIVGIFIFLPKYLPQIFSTYSIQISEGIRETASTITAAIGQGIGIASNGGLI